MIGRKTLGLAGLAVALACISGCGDKPSPAQADSTALRMATVNGLQAVQIRSYLSRAEETPAARLAVTWHPSVVQVDRESAMRSLRGVDRSGSHFVFAASEPALAQLQHGSILFVWGIAIRRVTALRTKGDYVLVQTRPVALNEALSQASIAFDTPLGLDRAFVSTHAARTPPVQTSQWGAPGSIVRVSDELPPGVMEEGSNPGEEPLADVEATPQSSFAGKVRGFDYEVAYTVAGTKLQFDLEARKSANDGEDDSAKAVQKMSARNAAVAKSAGGLAKGLFDQGYDDVDIRLKVKGQLDGLSENGAMRLGGRIEIVDSKLQLLNTDFKNLSGTASVDAIARLGSERGVFNHNFKVLDVPVTFNIPIILAGIPLVVEVGFNFLVQIGLNGKHAALHTSGAVQFQGNGSTTFSEGQVRNEGEVQGEPQLGEKSAISPGVSGFVVAVQVPKVGLGVGITNASIMSYIDHVSVVSIANTAALGSIVQCARYTLSSTAHVGVTANFSPLPIPGLGTKKDLYAKEIFSRQQLVGVPPTKACQS
ncbi:hypothetical protein ASE31_02605 [Acidovorax sp. Root217]|nr:hypothetical protein ASE31_02605 [Acidovorax sp. Root217]